MLKRFRQKAKQLGGPMPAFPAGARYLFQEAQLLNPPSDPDLERAWIALGLRLEVFEELSALQARRASIPDNLSSLRRIRWSRKTPEMVHSERA